MQIRQNRLRRWILPILLASLVLLGGLLYVNIRFIRSSPLWSEFFTVWNAANQWIYQGLNPYSVSVRQQAQEFLYSRPAVLSSGEHGCQLAIPLPSLLLIFPFGLLPYELARALMMSLIEICLVLSVVVGLNFSEWKPHWSLFIMLAGFSVLWLPGIQAVVTTNPRILALFFQLLSLVLFKQHRDLAAGFLAGLALTGLGAVLPLLVYLTIWAVKEKRYSFFSGWLSVAAAITGISLLILPRWPAFWLRETLRWLYEEKGFSSLSADLGIFNPFPLPAAASLAVAALVLVYLFTEWRLSLGKEASWFQWTAVMTLLLSQLLAVFPNTSLHILLIPVVCMILSAGSARWGKSSAWLSAAMLIFLLAGSWGLLYLGGNIENSFALIYGPVILLAAGMWWIRWWKIRGGFSLPMDYIQIPEE